MTETSRAVDVVIIGAGPVGLTLALALQGSGLSVQVIERRRLADQAADPRALALSEGARQLLAPLAAWPARAATPIHTIHISQRGGPGQTFLDRADYRLPALGYVLAYRDLAAALAAQVRPGTVLENAELLDVQAAPDQVKLALRQAGAVHHLSAGLLVHAEGTPDAGPGLTVRPYEQHAVIAEVRPDRPHGNRAWERFTPDGPLALLPLGERFSVVFTLPPAKADQVMGLDDQGFSAALTAQFGRDLSFSAPGPRSRFPLALRLRDTLVREREVWIGNAAQTLHPVSGQGFNLGLRDAWLLADLLCRKGLSAATLQRYARSRQLDRQGGALFTDLVVRLFSNDVAPLRLARGLGLSALDLFPPARHFVAKRMIWGARAWP